MRIKLDIKDIEGIRTVGDLIRSGGIIVFPTDTVFGIGGDPFNTATVDRVIELKKREAKPLPVLVAGEERAREVVDVGPVGLFLMKKFWPGALTIVLKEKGHLPKQLTQGRGTIGVREPNHALALKIIEASGGALIGTSANISGESAATTLDSLDPRIERNVDMVIDGYPPPGGVSSTVIEVVGTTRKINERFEERIRVLREGAIRVEAIRKKISESDLKGISFE